MRLKTFNGKSMQAVMTQVRETLGAEAIIVSVEQAGKGYVRVTAAVDPQLAPAQEPETPQPRPSPAAEEERGGQERRPGDSAGAGEAEAGFDAAELKAAVSHHGLPGELAQRIVETAGNFDAASLSDALAQALESLIGFSPLALEAGRPILFIGPPGAGKTVATAKLAAEALVNERAVRLISTDTVKSAGVDQLKHYAGLMGLSVTEAGDEDGLARIREETAGADLTVIDSCGLNPFVMDELEHAVRLIKACEAEPVLVLPAGLDSLEAADAAEIAARMGARRLVATRLDAARRYAGILTAARGGRLALAGLSRSPYLADPLETPTAMALARLLASLPTQKVTERVKERIV